jgi:predicted 2-oxoglutarate/Fe(II)-dependent dioxygenase YbiX
MVWGCSETISLPLRRLAPYLLNWCPKEREVFFWEAALLDCGRVTSKPEIDRRTGNDNSKRIDEIENFLYSSDDGATKNPRASPRAQRQADVLFNEPQQVSLGNPILQAEVVEQRFRAVVLPIMISSPPAIKQSMGECFLLTCFC